MPLGAPNVGINAKQRGHGKRFLNSLSFKQR
jgi:hypothetical protein